MDLSSRVYLAEAEMSYKLLFPTYRARERFVSSALSSLPGAQGDRRALNLGAGEGDLDRVIADHVAHLDSCDVNPADVATGKRLNGDLTNVTYSVQDGTASSFDDASFDVVLCLEVIEHVADPGALLDEISRVLRPGGHLILTGPNHDFPVAYDPVNFVIRRFGKTLPIGAYAYGHDRLVERQELESWLDARGFVVEQEASLSGTLASLTELYVPGLLQKIFKDNAGNVAGDGDGDGNRGRYALKPQRAMPRGLFLTDAVVHLDALLSRRSHRSVGLAYVLRKSR